MAVFRALVSLLIQGDYVTSAMTSGTISSMKKAGGRNTKKGKHTSMIFLLSNTNLVIH